MNQIDLSFFLEPPDLTVQGVLTVEALAPLSLIVDQPGSYFRSQPVPTDAMLYGMIENALGWHLSASVRSAIAGALRKTAAKKYRKTVWQDSAWLNVPLPASGSGYTSLLSLHLAIVGVRPPSSVMHYDDLWAQNLHDTLSSRFLGGSRRYDSSLERTMTRQAQGQIVFGDRRGFNVLDEETLEHAGEGAEIHFKSIRSRFPHYYVSPTAREYIEPDEPYQFEVHTTPRVAALIEMALLDPVAPLYLGANDGWVEATWEVLP